LSSARKFGNTRDLLGDLLGAKNAGITAAAGDTGRRSSGLKARRLVPHRPDPGVPEVVGPAPPVRRSFGQHKARHPWRSPRTMHSGDLDLREAASPMAGTSICERQLGLSVASLPPSLPPASCSTSRRRRVRPSPAPSLLSVGALLLLPVGDQWTSLHPRPPSARGRQLSGSMHMQLAQHCWMSSSFARAESSLSLVLKPVADAENCWSQSKPLLQI
jgi:hypothetical protein